jgi:murein DD-endopeptidase MepM/ murein hydrolase activator NlpD
VADWWEPYSDKPQPQAQAKPSAWKSFVNGITGRDWGNTADEVSDAVVKGAADVAGMVEDNLPLLNPLVNPQGALDRAKQLLRDPRNMMSSPATERIKKHITNTAGEPLPQDKGDVYAHQAVEGAVAGAPLGPAGALSGAGGAVGGQAASDLFPESEVAPIIGNIVGGMIPAAHFVMPVRGRITSGFGEREAPIAGASTYHQGIDIAVPSGTPVQAPEAGVISRIGADRKAGRWVEIDHGDGLKTKYLHLGEIHGKVGDEVAPGDVFAKSGATGNVTGPHLHWAAFKDGKAIDPRTLARDPAHPPARPMAPQEIADIMNDPEAAGAATEIPGEAPPEDQYPSVEGDKVDMEGTGSLEDWAVNAPEKTPDNVVDMGKERDIRQTQGFLDAKLREAADLEERVLNGEKPMTPEDATINRQIADNMHEIMTRENHPYQEATGHLQNMWRNIEDTLHGNKEEVLTPAEKQDMDASADKPIVDNTGYEKFTKPPVRKLPANQGEYPEAGKRGFHSKETTYNARIILNEVKSGRGLPDDKWDIIHRTLADAKKSLVKNIRDRELTPEEQNSMKDVVAMLEEAATYDPRRGGGGQEPPKEPPAGGGGSEQPPKGPEKGPVAKLRALLDRAEPLQKKQAKAVSAERSQRLGKAAGSAKKLTGEARHNAALAALKGEYDKPYYPSIKDQFSPEEVGQLMDMIYEHPELNDFDKIAAGNGLKKLLGAEEMGIPSKSELEALKHVFPADLIDRLSKSKLFTKDFYDHVSDVLNAPRTIMASFDISAPGRQGIFLVGRKQFYTSIPDMFKAMPSKEAFKSVMDTIKRDPNYKYMIRGDVEFTGMDHNPSMREERFQSNIADKIPGISHSERAYVAYLNKLRADVFSHLIDKGKELGIDWDKNGKALKDLGKYINTATGRGSVGQFQQAANILNGLFFSPRLMASRLRLLNPMFYYRLHPFVRREALTDLFKFAGVATTILTLAAAGGASVEFDPRSTDWAKIKIHNTRLEITGGFQPYLRLFAQLATGQKKTQSGKIKELGEGQTPSGLETAATFLVGKENPVASFATDILRTSRTDLTHGKLKDVVGQKHSIPAAVASRFIPLIIQDVTDAMQSDGAKGIALAAPSLVGVGVQTYKPYKKQTADQKRRSDKEEWWDKYK